MRNPRAWSDRGTAREACLYFILAKAPSHPALRWNGACVKPATDAEPARPHRRLDVDLEALDELRRVVERVAETLLRIAKVEVFKPPFTLPGFAVKQHWHERYQQDPSNRWLRSVIADLFLER